MRTVLAFLIAVAPAVTPLTALVPSVVSAQAKSKLQLEIRDNDIDIAARTIHFRLTGGTVERVDIEILSPEGQTLYAGHEDFDHAVAGAPLSVSWPDLVSKVRTSGWS